MLTAVKGINQAMRTYPHPSVWSQDAKSDNVHLCCVAWVCLKATRNGTN